ncbi:MAG: hypothetical protein AABY18_02675 [Candidatus Thermoplasmatota archaeon]
MSRLSLLCAAVALVLAAPMVVGANADVHEVSFDRIEAVAVADFRFIPCQDTGAFVLLENGFRFEERQPGTGDAQPYPGGYLAIGCGEAAVTRTAPAGARSVEVLFQGDRVVEEFDVQGNSVTRPGVAFDQRIAFRSGNASSDRQVDYMDPGAGSLPMQPVAPDSFLLARSAATFDLAWVFSDQSYFVGPDFPDVLSGQAFSATVQNVTLRYPGLPVASKVTDSLQREGTLLVGKTRIAADISDPEAGDLRVVVANGLAFSHLRAPDGTKFDTQASRLAAGPDGFDRSAVLVETLEDGSVQVTVPREVLTDFGAGRYTVSFTSVGAVHTFPWLIPVAVLVLLAPLPFALLAYLHVRRFEDEAFGGFRRSARNLRIALVVAFAYYVAVLVSHFAGSRLDLMTAWPLPFEAFLLYLQVVIAVGAFLALFAVARELYRITVPKALPDAARAGPAPMHEDAE